MLATPGADQYRPTSQPSHQALPGPPVTWAHVTQTRGPSTRLSTFLPGAFPDYKMESGNPPDGQWPLLTCLSTHLPLGSLQPVRPRLPFRLPVPSRPQAAPVPTSSSRSSCRDSRSQLLAMGGGGRSCPRTPHGTPPKRLWTPLGRWGRGTSTRPHPWALSASTPQPPDTFAWLSRPASSPGNPHPESSPVPTLPVPCLSVLTAPSGPPVHPGHPSFSLSHPGARRGLTQDLPAARTLLPLPSGRAA